MLAGEGRGQGAGGARCCVRGCDITLHHFPSSSVQKINWLKSIGHLLTKDTTDAYICSSHFEEDCFALTGRLLDDAVPTIPYPHQNSPAISKVVSPNAYNLPPKLERLDVNDYAQADEDWENNYAEVKKSSKSRLSEIKTLRQRCAQLEKKNVRLKGVVSALRGAEAERNNGETDQTNNADVSEMSVDVCQVCLVTGVRLHHIDSVLRQRLQSLMGVQCDTHTRYVCYECFALLRKFDALRGKSQRSQFVLSAISQVVRTVTTKTIIESVDRSSCRLMSTLTAVNCNKDIIDIVHEDPKERIEVKNEELNEEFNYVEDDDFKWDTNSEHGYANLNVDYSITNDEPIKYNDFLEIDVPISSPIIFEQPKSLPVLKTALSKPNKVTIYKPVKLRAKNKYDKSEYTLSCKTYEQAMEEMREKRDSPQYQNSKFKCELCYRWYSMKSALDNHMVFHDPKLKLECEFCHVRFHKRKALASHMSGYHGYMYHCKRCPFVTTARSLILRHKKGHKTEVHQCKHCEKIFKSQSTLMSHVFHKHDRNYVCDLCGKDFVNQQGIRTHKHLMHILEKNVPIPVGPRCEPCQVQFASKDALKRHLIVSSKHNRDNALNGCEICLEQFPSRAELKEHEKGHAGKRPRVRVSIAKPKYRKPANPKEKGGQKNKHIEWPIQCDHCETLLYSGREHWRHYKVEHPGTARPEIVEQNFICDVCGIRRPTKALLTHHKLRHQEKQFECQECYKKFAYKISLNRHMALHTGDMPFSCDICGKQFNNAGNLTRHVAVHKGVRYKCEYCDKIFTQTSARLTHIKYVHLKLPYPKRDRTGRSNNPNRGHSTRPIGAIVPSSTSSSVSVPPCGAESCPSSPPPAPVEPLVYWYSKN